MAKKRNFSNDLQLLLYINLTILVLMLAAFNLSQKTKKTIQVLGAETDSSYWQELVIKHPTYRDAWVELGRMDIVEQIDPNYN
ncbi:MAG: hypothetical protein WA152_01965 [Microgenomates group bacterium]